MNHMIHPILAAALLASPAFASDINVDVRSGGTDTITVFPGATVTYEVVAELSDAANEGLGFVVFDLAFDGGALSQAAAPTTNPMLNFASPVGLSNPAGFGGTPKNGKLLQIGGAQNTWGNAFAPKPTGNVITQVGHPTQPVVIVTGTLTAPLNVGTYTLKVENLAANVIRQGETGSPFWAVEPAGLGNVQDLTIEVSAISADVTTLSLSNPGIQTITLNAGPFRPNRPYLMLGTLSGTSPGIPVGIQTLPINFDGYSLFLFSNPNPAFLVGSMGFLNAQGVATAQFKLPANLAPALAGTVIHHAYVLMNPLNFASDAQIVTLVP